MFLRIAPWRSLWLPVACAILVAVAGGFSPTARAQDTTTATSPNAPPAQEPNVAPATEAPTQAERTDLAQRRKDRRSKKSSRSGLLSRVTALLAIVGAAGAAYAFMRLRALTSAVARLSDTVSSQSRQIDELRRSRGGS